MLIDGKATAAKIREEIKKEIAGLENKPGLAVVLIGNDPASEIYVRNKHNACQEVGFESLQHKLPEDTTEEDLLDLIEKLNKDDRIDGILVQFPVPKHINSRKVIYAIDPAKDVDGFSPINQGKSLIGEEALTPCTPTGVMKLFQEYNIDLNGKDVVMIGRSNIVGKPLANMMINAGGTVSICHSRTKDLSKYTKDADVIVSAVGKANLVTPDMVKEGAVIIDVGMNRVDGKLCGDVDFEGLKDKCSFITPVPGGVGPMTIASLLINTLRSFRMKKEVD
jgi:methylenetetrahydrofolate dehydrogenase (NADP+)/methenyltetrahydrofolate cyclohydrolase